MRQGPVLWVGLWAAAAICGCVGCAGFDQQYEQQLSAAPAAPAGAWTGAWASAKTKHSGAVRAVIVPAESPQRYDATFQATWGWLFRSEVQVTLVEVPTSAGVLLKGDKDLGFLAGGVHRFNGMVTGDQLVATYQSDSDRGKLTLMRPGAAPITPPATSQPAG